MGFVNNVRNIINNAGQETVKKANDLGETSRLNGLIAENQNKIRQHYAMIGERYYKAYADCPVEEVRDMVEAIKQMEQTIANCQTQINKIKGIIPCPHCGKDTSINAPYCSNCGGKMPQKVEKRCAFCGSIVADGTKFCMKCGKPVAEKPVQVAKKQCPQCGMVADANTLFCANCGFNFNAPVSNAVISADEAEKKVCSKCGNKLDAGETFCPECGTPVHQSATNDDDFSVAAVQKAAEAVVEPPKNVCPQCGNEIAPGDAFCAECGYRV